MAQQKAVNRQCPSDLLVPIQLAGAHPTCWCPSSLLVPIQLAGAHPAFNIRVFIGNHQTVLPHHSLNILVMEVCSEVCPLVVSNFHDTHKLSTLNHLSSWGRPNAGNPDAGKLPSICGPSKAVDPPRSRGSIFDPFCPGWPTRGISCTRLLQATLQHCPST